MATSPTLNQSVDSGISRVIGALAGMTFHSQLPATPSALHAGHSNDKHVPEAAQHLSENANHTIAIDATEGHQCNRSRQAAITTELIEIIAGAEAL